MNDEMKDEYDFSDGVRGKYYEALRDGYITHIDRGDGTVETYLYTPATGDVLIDTRRTQNSAVSKPQ